MSGSHQIINFVNVIITLALFLGGVLELLEENIDNFARERSLAIGDWRLVIGD
jgi:hypothetical protein